MKTYSRIDNIIISVQMWRNGGQRGGKLLDNATWGIAPQEIQPLVRYLGQQQVTQIRFTNF